jgi:hypothetical protein
MHSYFGRFLARDLAYVGGEYAFEIYREVLSKPADTYQVKQTPSDFDVSIDAHEAVIEGLSALFPAGPTNSGRVSIVQSRRLWLQWLTVNKRELRKLKPKMLMNLNQLPCLHRNAK